MVLSHRSSPRAWGAPLEPGRVCARVRFIPTPRGGERSCVFSTISSQSGSSPRAWGARRSDHGPPRPLRFIPTRVGSATDHRGHPHRSPVHPHARGERKSPPSSAVSAPGSSPRAWGARRPDVDGRVEHRFIPTRVGSASCPRRRRRARSVHPHARGERVGRAPTRPPSHGSSPRAWGALLRRRPVLDRRRFIPTRVGSAAFAVARAPVIPVHPHARGERATRLAAVRSAFGSSPRAWGALERVSALIGGRRFIPTRVGSAACLTRWESTPPVHPHARGERRPNRRRWSASIGSSPRAWGALGREARDRLQVRFIPTRVGSAPLSGEVKRRTPVHPHARGERRHAARVHEVGRGSSPRAWGARAVGG